MNFPEINNLAPLKFTPVYQERIWGGTLMNELLSRETPAGVKTGEAWEISDRPGAESIGAFLYLIYFARNSMNACLFSWAVVVGRPRSSLAPMAHLTSMRLSSFLARASARAASSASKLSTDTALG